MKAAADLAMYGNGFDQRSPGWLGGRLMRRARVGDAYPRLGVRLPTSKRNATATNCTGQGCKAQAMILDILNSKFGGKAQAMVNTYAGRMGSSKHLREHQRRSAGRFFPM